MAAKKTGAEDVLRDFALAYPEAHEAFPWGERAIKVGTKAFTFMRTSKEGFGISAKLPDSAAAALALPFAEPTHYGLGKSGWVTASFKPKENPPLELLRQWIDESYRAIAPQKLVAQLDGKAAKGRGKR